MSYAIYIPDECGEVSVQPITYVWPLRVTGTREGNAAISTARYMACCQGFPAEAIAHEAVLEQSPASHAFPHHGNSHLRTRMPWNACGLEVRVAPISIRPSAVSLMEWGRYGSTCSYSFVLRIAIGLRVGEIISYLHISPGKARHTIYTDSVDTFSPERRKKELLGNRIEK